MIPPTRDLAAALRAAHPSDAAVALLPDFFLDHFVELPDFKSAEEAIARIHAQGGGNIPIGKQTLAPGGNAGNTALALARLGARASLVARTSRFGAEYLRATLGREGVDLSRVRDDGDLAVTTALEFPTGNVMLSSPGSVADFGPERLAEDDWALVAGADAVLVANWTLNRRGTDLAVEVARRARAAGVRTYVDTGDPSARAPDVPDFLARLAPSPDLDALGINENELSHYEPTGIPSAEGVLAAAERFSRRVAGRLDLHTSVLAASFERGRLLGAVPAFEVRPLRATGAGDAWNAGNILADVLGFPAPLRLMTANAVAAAYVTSPEARHPSWEALSAFAERTPLKRLPEGVTSLP